ncbi:MAG: LysM peptidoglycan-binding domain-containing protein [Chloroflexi bacterium]|nr:LysM peptidoglycan-binding domain-containing protein [Chloroflexota bacterium]
MQSITRDAYFGLAGIVILGIVVWILITQVGLGGGEQANGEVATVEPGVSQTEPPTATSPDAPTSDASDAIEEEATPTPTPLPEIHVVQAGETLSQIAGLYGLTAESIAAKNRLDDPNAILAGQRLVLPQPDETFTPVDGGGQAEDEYVVQEGDTLYAIAQEFGLSVEALAEANDIEDQSQLFVGTTLKIPEKTVPTPRS